MSLASPTPPAVPVGLCLGGLDPSGGAGLLRDALTLAELGVHPMTVPLAETVQNGLLCSWIGLPSAEPLARLEALAPHLTGTWGVKVGMSALEPEALRTLAERLTALAPSVLIWDPVQAPTAGVGLHGPAALRAMAALLLGQGGWVASPNRIEAQTLAGEDTQRPEDLARPFLDLGARAVWLKGGHAAGPLVEDLWITASGCRGLGAWPRLPGERRGTGCAVASAWLAFRLHGSGEADAAVQAIGWLRSRWARAFAPGSAGRPLFAPEAP